MQNMFHFVNNQKTSLFYNVIYLEQIGLIFIPEEYLLVDKKQPLIFDFFKIIH